MEDGVRAARGEIVVFLDGDLTGLPASIDGDLVEPIRAGRADFVKASFSRAGGRVTTLTAKPLLETFFPALRHVEQPLGGLVAARRSLLRRLRFETDYGADVGLLIDAAEAHARIEQVHVGRIVHDSQPLEVLGEMAKQVSRVILDRAARRGRLRPRHVREVAEVEWHAQAEIATVLARVGAPPRVALFAIDGVLTQGSFLRALARRTGRLAAYEAARGEALEVAGRAHPDDSPRLRGGLEGRLLEGGSRRASHAGRGRGRGRPAAGGVPRRGRLGGQPPRRRRREAARGARDRGDHLGAGDAARAGLPPAPRLHGERRPPPA
jgi:hypothetical protein